VGNVVGAADGKQSELSPAAWDVREGVQRPVAAKQDKPALLLERHLGELVEALGHSDVDGAPIDALEQPPGMRDELRVPPDAG
jgi:hypothetical protein